MSEGFKCLQRETVIRSRFNQMSCSSGVVNLETRGI